MKKLIFFIVFLIIGMCLVSCEKVNSSQQPTKEYELVAVKCYTTVTSDKHGWENKTKHIAYSYVDGKDNIVNKDEENYEFAGISLHKTNDKNGKIVIRGFEKDLYLTQAMYQNLYK